MSKQIGLDLSKFKHVSSDEHSTKLRHYEGHEITLAHKKLSKANQEALMAMAAKSKAKADAPQMEADGGRIVGVRSKTAANGVKGADAVRSKQDVPHGMTIQVEKPVQKDQNFGKVLDPKGNKPQVFSHGGDVQMMAEAGVVQPDDASIPPDIAAASAPDESQPAPPTPGQGLPDISGAGILQAQSAQDPSNRYEYIKKLPLNLSDSEALDITNEEARDREAAGAARAKEAGTETNQVISLAQKKAAAGIPLSPQEQAAMATVQSQPQQAQAPQTPGTGQAPQGPTSQPGGMGDYEGMLMGGYNKQMAGIQAGAKAQGDLGQAQADVLDKQIAAQQQAQSAYQQSFQALDKERQSHIADIQSGYINPDKYWTGYTLPNGDKVDGHSKIASSIGMILAGFNPTGAPNAAVNMLKYQMDQSIQAQQANLQSDHNLLAANLKQFGNVKDAADMTRLQMNDVLQSKLQMAAANAQTPMAKAAATQAMGKLQTDMAPIAMQLSMRRAMIGMATNPNGQNPQAIDQMLGYMRVTNPDMAKEMEGRYVPGVGLGTVPVPQEARQQIIAHKSVNDLMNTSIQFSKQHAGSLDPQVRAQASTIQNQLIGSIKQAQHDGVYKPSEAEFLTSQIGGSPASFLASMSSVPKIREMQQIKQQEYGNLLKTYGIQGAQLPQSGANQNANAALQWAKANPKDPRAAQILSHLGQK